MKGFDGVTDNDWFAFLSQQPGSDEVNFWQPGRIEAEDGGTGLDSGQNFTFDCNKPKAEVKQ